MVLQRNYCTTSHHEALPSSTCSYQAAAPRSRNKDAHMRSHLQRSAVLFHSIPLPQDVRGTSSLAIYRTSAKQSLLRSGSLKPCTGHWHAAALGGSGCPGGIGSYTFVENFAKSAWAHPNPRGDFPRLPLLRSRTVVPKFRNPGSLPLGQLQSSANPLRPRTSRVSPEADMAAQSGV